MTNIEPINAFQFCPKCKAKLTSRLENVRHIRCDQCGFELYLAPSVCNSVIILNQKSEVLLVKRKFEPEIDKWDLPGGFIEFDETLEQSVIREAKEELGVDICNLKYLCSAVDYYDFGGIRYHTLGFTFTAKADAHAEMKPQDDVSELRYFSFEDIPWSEIGFISIANALRLLQKK